MIALVILLIVGLALEAVEIFLTPKVWLAGLCGALCLAGACFLAFSGQGPVTGCILTTAVVTLVVAVIIWKRKTDKWKKKS